MSDIIQAVLDLLPLGIVFVPIKVRLVFNRPTRKTKTRKRK